MAKCELCGTEVKVCGGDATKHCEPLHDYKARCERYEAALTEIAEAFEIDWNEARDIANSALEEK